MVIYLISSIASIHETYITFLVDEIKLNVPMDACYYHFMFLTTYTVGIKSHVIILVTVYIRALLQSLQYSHAN